VFLLLRMAWRNLFRNTRRTIITGTAVAVGLAALILALALFDGVRVQMEKRLTEDFLADGQIHADGYRRTRDAALTIPDGMELLDRLDDDPRVQAVAPRAVAFGLLSSADDALGVRVFGVTPEAEKQVTRFHCKLSRGNYFEGRHRRELIMGERAAHTLRVRLGSRVVLTLSQPGTGDLAQQLFRVAGEFKSGTRALDTGLVLIRLSDLQRLLGKNDDIHEIAVQLTPGVRKDRVRCATFWRELNHPPVEALPWQDLAPQFQAIQRLQWVSFAILVGIVFVIIALGIMNTLLMSLFERTREFGILRSLGTRPWQLGCLIVLEAGSLAIFAAFPGTVLGVAVSAWFQFHGIDWSGMSYGGVNFTEPTRALITPGSVIASLAVIIATTLIVAVFPAVKAMRLRPTDALRHH